MQDTTFEFERRRNVLDKYDRETMEKTIKAMTRISEIQQRRQDRFYQNRMKGKKAAQKLQVCASCCLFTIALALLAAATFVLSPCTCPSPSTPLCVCESRTRSTSRRTSIWSRPLHPSSAWRPTSRRRSSGPRASGSLHPPPPPLLARTAERTSTTERNHSHSVCALPSTHVYCMPVQCKSISSHPPCVGYLLTTCVGRDTQKYSLADSTSLNVCLTLSPVTLAPQLWARTSWFSLGKSLTLYCFRIHLRNMSDPWRQGRFSNQLIIAINRAFQAPL